MFLEVDLNLTASRTNVSARYGVQGPRSICGDSFRRAGLARARGPVKQYDEAAAFASHKVDLHRRLVGVLAGIVIDNLLAGFVVLDESNQELPLLVANDQVLEASPTGSIALIDRLQQVEIQSIYYASASLKIRYHTIVGSDLHHLRDRKT